METLIKIKVDFFWEIPENFTGIAECSNGDKYWFLNGKHHREDGPACEYADGDKCWYINGKFHRTDGPACEWHGGASWYLNDKYHRTDGPAIEWSNGSKQWYINGKYHRTDGPAVEHKDGYKAWFLNGKEYSEKDWQKEIAKRNDPSNVKYIHSRIEYSNEVPRNFTGIACHLNGSKEWYLNGKECSEADWEERNRKITVFQYLRIHLGLC